MIIVSILSLIGVVVLVFEYIFHHRDKQKIVREIRKLEKEKHFGSQVLKRSPSITKPQLKPQSKKTFSLFQPKPKKKINKFVGLSFTVGGILATLTGGLVYFYNHFKPKSTSNQDKAKANNPNNPNYTSRNEPYSRIPKSLPARKLYKDISRQEPRK
jgi:uncharacterized membrane protein YciS (DUF1049 family)